MDPITWEWITTEHETSVCEWESARESLQEHLRALRSLIEVPERKVLYQVDDAVRTAIKLAVKTWDGASPLSVDLGANWTPPGGYLTPWLNPWPAKKFLVEFFCNMPAYQTLMNSPLRQKFPQYWDWVQAQISDIIRNVWKSWIHSFLPNVLNVTVQWDTRNRPGHPTAIDLVYSIVVEFAPPIKSPSLYQPLIKH